jgi:hypothetical protein
MLEFIDISFLICSYFSDITFLLNDLTLFIANNMFLNNGSNTMILFNINSMSM